MKRQAWTRRGRIGHIGQSIYADADRFQVVVRSCGNTDDVSALVFQSKVGRVSDVVVQVPLTKVAVQVRIRHYIAVSIAFGIVGQAHGDRHRNKGLRSAAVQQIMIRYIDRPAFFTVDVVEVFPIDEGVPDVCLRMSDGTTPAFARTKTLTGSETLRIFLPGDDESCPLNRFDFDPEGIAPAGRQAFCLGPDHVRLFRLPGSRVIARQQHAPGGPHATERNFACLSVAFLCKIDGAL